MESRTSATTTTEGPAGTAPIGTGPTGTTAAETAPAGTTPRGADALLDVYWRDVAPEDLDGRAEADLVHAVESHLELAAHRVPGQLALRVQTPDPRSASWAGGHTVIEVVTDDMPFLVDSVAAELARHELGVHLLVHPQVVVRRHVLGALQEVSPPEVLADPTVSADGALAESWMHVEVDRVGAAADRDRLANDLRSVLTDVRDAVEDWHRMKDRAVAIADELAEVRGLEAGTDGVGSPSLPVPDSDIVDARELLRWLADDHFAFLGYRDYVLAPAGRSEDDPPVAGARALLRAVPGSGLGILRGDQRRPRDLNQVPEEVRAKALEKRLLIITKANSRSTVHRPAYLDYVGVKTFDAAGDVVGERRFVGLFSSAAYLESVRNLPVVRRKVDDVIRRSGLSLTSHSGKGLLAILETYPRDELFQTGSAELFDTVMGVLRLAGKRQLRLFLRRDAYARFVSCLVYLPRDRYTTRNRLRMQEILTEELHGIGVDFTTRVTESTLARVHFIVRTDPASPPVDVDPDAVQARLADVTRSWDDDFAAALREDSGEEQSRDLLRRFRDAFGQSYKEDHDVGAAVDDVSRLEALEEPGALAMSLYRPAGAGDELRFTVYRHVEPMSLSEVLPVLQSMGLRVVDERPYEVRRTDGSTTYLYDFGLGGVADVSDLERVSGAAENAFAATWRGDAEVDGFNALVLSAGLTWQQVTVLRAYSRYLRQAGTLFSQDYIEQTVVAHPAIARDLLELFATRFDPAGAATGTAAVDAHRERRSAELVDRVRARLDDVPSLDEDRILRSLLGLVLATLRTTYYRRGDDGRATPHLALKLDPRAVPDLPEPRPRFEVFVYSPRFEGVHLRFGAVARGGLRWSDRREDFRTEILGLVKAQMVKNSVIVPVGAKGGFVLKRPPAGGDRDALLAEGVACYQLFISALLDLTDNLVAHGTGGGDDGTGAEVGAVAATVVVPPRDVVRHDGDDPYLVVAADKGTATFSDLANSLAVERGFWLGDAFASGGSVGYDHKRMGITARGAWESVRRHFRETGHDTQTQDFTVVGVGDMSGDVFGNGMLLSEHIRLVAAFDHRHVFLDPTPDPAVSFGERRRLFELARSSWDDYDRSLISAGGGIFPRTTKSVPVSPEVRAALGIADESVERLSPADLMKAILLADVDLLWNGGIGTYVKASTESSADVGDKSNDAVRVDGRDLRCTVVGEGGNLGLTQRGRIEYALGGGRINTDAIDNSAGVDTSDHEVNIKILLDRAIPAGELAEADRNPLLAAMTDEVAALVLRHNYDQNVTLGNAREQAASLLPVHIRLMHDLERQGRLDRRIEFLPDDAELADRAAAGLGLTSPELAVLLAYVKIALTDEVLGSDLPGDRWCASLLVDYFPTPLRERFDGARESHPLRREIITTVAANDIVNRGGTSFVFRALEETGSNAADVVRAYVVVRDVFGLRALWQETEALDNRMTTGAQTAVALEVRRLMDRAVRWLVQSRRSPIEVETEIARLAPGVQDLLPKLGALFCGTECEAMLAHGEQLASRGVPTELAGRVTRTLYGFGLLDVVEVAERTRRPHVEVAQVYYRLSDRFGIDALLERISALPRDDRWQSLARTALRYDLYAALAELTREVLESTPPDAAPAERVRTWEQANASSLARAQNTLGEFVQAPVSDLAALSVVLRQIRTLVRASAASPR